MADGDAEKAFFEAQALNAGAMDYGITGEQQADSSEPDVYDPSKPMKEQDFPSSVGSSASDARQQDSLSRDYSPGHAANDTYPSQTPSRPESGASAPNPPAQPKARTIGGFVVDEDEDEEDDNGDAEYEPPAVLGDFQDMATVSADIPQRAASQSAKESVSTSHVSLPQTAPEQDSSKNVSKDSSHSPPQFGSSAQNDKPSNPSQADLQSQAPMLPVDTPVPTPPITAAPRTRLPHDRVGILEDRIQEDPRGDTDAWIELINEHRNRNKIESAREVYERFFKVFPAAAEQWVSYATMESENNELYRLEQIFNKTLLSIPSVQLWSVYLDYVRRRNNLTTDTTGQARRIISSAYDFALQNIGMDKDSSSIWTDYVQFIRSGPGNIGGSGWQDQQKMDLLRKAYQKAICVPTHAVNTLWKEYDQFEMGLNKLTGRKFIQERSPSYMTARSSFTELQNITRDLVRVTLPRLPPAPGCDGEDDFNRQVQIWKRWIQWEKDDPLVLKEEDAPGYRTRILYVYKQALMAMRFVPEIWFDAADFCFQNKLDTEGSDFLKQGIDANPESCLLAFKCADHLEITTESEQDSKKRGTKVKEPYDKVLDALYELITKARAKEAQSIARIEETFANSDGGLQPPRVDDDDDDEGDSDAKAKVSAKTSQIEAVKKEYATEIGLLSRTVSFAWIALMRAMRRIQGKGKPGEMAGSRQIFADARKRGRITSDVYIASALIEYHCYKDPAATKIFERGAKLFPEDEVFALEYLKHLIDINDVTNARAVFETTVRRLASTPENLPKAKPIFAFLHEYESRYGDLVQVINLEKRMRELYPEDPSLKQFAHRHSTSAFDPTAVHLIISPSQTKPKEQQAEDERPSRNSPSPRYLDAAASSPKRPLPADDFDDDYNRPRKHIRAESPLKGAAGRRLDQQKRTQQVNGGGPSGPSGHFKPQAPPVPPPLPRDVMFLLSIIPNVKYYDAPTFSAEKVVNLLRRVDIPSGTGQSRQPQQMPQMGGGRPQFSASDLGGIVAAKNAKIIPQKPQNAPMIDGVDHSDDSGIAELVPVKARK
ncbi:Cleavage stimulation factor subunit 3 [Arachnomyces sp. PD_36]|nr:Cleavage stimulation factor subunit 3 [Arachnomyces sp. PD_36]